VSRPSPEEVEDFLRDTQDQDSDYFAQERNPEMPACYYIQRSVPNRVTRRSVWVEWATYQDRQAAEEELSGILSRGGVARIVADPYEPIVEDLCEECGAPTTDRVNIYVEDGTSSSMLLCSRCQEPEDDRGWRQKDYL
jgi:hypothetical protein